MKNSRGAWFPYKEPSDFPLWLPYSANEKPSRVTIIVECACFIIRGGIQRRRNPAGVLVSSPAAVSRGGGIL